MLGWNSLSARLSPKALLSFAKDRSEGLRTGNNLTFAAGLPLLLDPALFPELYLQYSGDFFGHILGPAFDCAAAALLPVYFHPSTDYKPGRVGGRNGPDNTQRCARRLASTGIRDSGAEFSETTLCHQIACRRCFQLSST